MGLPTIAVQDNRELKSYAVFYQLKSLFVGGIVRDYRKKTKLIASTFGYGERKLRTYISLLVKNGLAEIVNRHHLVLRASKFVSSLHGVSKKKFWRVPASKVSELEDIFRVLALQENIKRQQFLLESKVVDCAISTCVGIPNPTTSLQPSRLRALRKAYAQDYDKLLNEQQTRYTDSVATLQVPKKDSIFPWATLSRQGVATVLNRKSKATGHKYAKRFAALGYIQDERNTVFVGDFSFTEFTELQETVLDHDYTFRYIDGGVYKVLPNLLTMNAQAMLF